MTKTDSELSAVAVSSSSSRVSRETPQGSDIHEGSTVSIDGQTGTVKWIGYELSKTGRYFAGVKMVCHKSKTLDILTFNLINSVDSGSISY